MRTKPTYEDLEKQVSDLRNQVKKLQSMADNPIKADLPFPHGLAPSVDMTDKKKADEKIHFQERILENVQQAIIVTDSARRVIFWNAFAEKLFGWQAGEVIGRTTTEFLINKGSAQDSEERLACLRQGRSWSGEYTTYHRNGSVIPIRSMVTPIFSKEEQLVYYVSISYSIAEQKRSEKLLKESEKRYRKLFTEMISGAALYEIICDDDGKPVDFVTLEVNRALESIVGLSRNELIGKKFSEIALNQDTKDFAAWVEMFGKVALTGKSVTYDQYASGSGKMYEGAAYCPQHGRFAVTFNDVTELKRTEYEIRQQRDLIERIMETSPSGVTWVNKDGRVIYANKRAEEILGMTIRDETTRTYYDPLWDITDFNGQKIPAKKLPFNVVKNRGKPISDIQHAIQWPDGKRVYLSINAAPLFDDQGDFDGIVAAVEDITGKYQSEQNYQALFREMIDGFAVHEMVYDKQGRPVDYRFLAVNPSFERITGLKAENLLGKTVLEVLPNTEPYWIEKYGHVAQTGEPLEFEDYSQEIGLYLHVTAYKPTENQFACIFVDITERKKAEKALKESHERFLSVLDGIDATVYVTDMRSYEILFMNKAMIDLYGHDMTGELCYKAFRKKQQPCSHCTHHHLIDENGNPSEITSWQDKNPVNGRWYVNQERAIKWTDGRIVRMQIATDITEIKKLEERLQQAQKMEAIGNLAGGIAHDFNNILFPIIGMSEMLIEDLPSGSLEKENAEEILNAGRRGADLVKQILAFSRQTEQKKIPMRIQHVLKEVLKLSRSTIAANIEISQDIRNDCDMVMADPTQIHQIAMNLIINAFHAVEAENGAISVELREVNLEADELSTDSLTPGRYVILTVSDTGIGIDPDNIDKIFEPYFSTKEMGKGTGLGLSVVYGIVKGHRGDIKVYSKKGEGTTFSVYLPVMERVRHPESVLYEEGDWRGNENILLVDDEKPIVTLEKRILERLGYQVTERLSSHDALETFTADPSAFDLVISDMNMPNMTGCELAGELIAIRPDIPIIICTGFSERVSPEKIAELGIKDFLMKPIIKSDMANTVRKVLNDAKD